MAAPHPSESNFLVTFLSDGWPRLFCVVGCAGRRTRFLRVRANVIGAVAMVRVRFGSQWLCLPIANCCDLTYQEMRR